MSALTVSRLSMTHDILFDEADRSLIEGHRWFVRATHSPGLFYAGANVPREDGGRTTVTMHQLLTGLNYVDHANGNGLDNRRVNLRQATLSQQGANRRSFASSSSQFKGVSWHKRYGYWQARIRVDGKLHHLGCFASETDAAEAYNTAAIEHWGEFARLNKWVME